MISGTLKEFMRLNGKVQEYATKYAINEILCYTFYTSNKKEYYSILHKNDINDKCQQMTQN